MVHLDYTTESRKGKHLNYEKRIKIETREEYEHWEVNMVVGKQGTVLSERKTRQEIIFKIKSKSQYCVVKALDMLERKIGNKKFRETFKIIIWKTLMMRA